MTTALANSTTTGILPANTYLRVLGNSIVTITRNGAFVASQSTARDNYIGPYPVDSDYSVVAGDASIDIKLTGEEGPTEALVPAHLRTVNNNTVLVGADGSEILFSSDFAKRDGFTIDAVVWDSWRSGKGTYTVSASGAGTATFKADALFPRQSDYVTEGLAASYVQQTHSSIPYQLPQLSADDVLLVPVKLTAYTTQAVPNYPAAVTVNVFVSSDGFSTKSATMTGYLHPIKFGEWGIAVIPCSTFSSANGQLVTDKFNWTGVRLTNAGSDGSTPMTATVAGIYKQRNRRPKLIIEFDDAWAGVYTYAFPAMQALGIPGTICVIAGTVGTAGYCTDAQLREMKAAGWNMIVHGFYNHSDLVNEAGVLADVLVNQAYVRSLGDDGFDYVLPQGVLETYTNAALATAGIKTSRTTKAIATAPEPDVAMISSPMLLLARPITNAAGVSSLLDFIDNAILQQSTAIIYGHDIKVTVIDANQDISVANWNSLIAEIGARVSSQNFARQGAIDAITMREWRSIVSFDQS